MRPEPLWRRYLRFIRPDTVRDVDEELAFHLQQAEDDLVARGRSREAARREARERFGPVRAARDACLATDRRRLRAEGRARLFEETAQDLRYGLRSLWQHRGFSAAVVGTLALGIGATTAMFSAVDAALLRPLPFADPGRLVVISGITVPFHPPGWPERPSDVPDYRTMSELTPVFSRVAAFAAGGLNLGGTDRPERVRVGEVTATFFGTLGVAPASGRVFLPEEGRPDGPRVAILSAGLAHRQFGGGAVGRTILLNDSTYQVVGVMPPGFGFPAASDLWIPMTVPLTFASFAPFRGYIPVQVMGRLAPGVTLGAASARIDAMWHALPDSLLVNRNLEGAPLKSLQADLAGARRTALLVLLCATGLLLLIAATNVANLLRARAAVRGREIALRAALGASRGRLARQLVVESLLLALAGAVCGIALATAGLGIVRTLLPDTLTQLAPIGLDLRVLGFAVTLSVVTGLGFGAWPALAASRADANETLKGGGHGATTHGAGRVRRVLVAGELAVALVLVIGAGLMLRSFRALIATDPGFQPDRVATLELAFGSRPGAARLDVLDRIVERLDAAPGVAAAGVVNDLPLGAAGGIAIAVEPEGGAPAAGDGRFARYLQASAGYFEAMGIRLLRGRLMTSSDDARAPHVVVVSETMARTLWPGQDPLGRRLVERPNPGSPPGTPTTYRTVIGVVSDVRDHNLESEPWPEMYWPIAEVTPTNAAVVVRGTLPASRLLNTLRRAVQEVDPAQPVFHLRTMDDVMAASLAPRRTNTTLITAFGALALLLAMVGVYGVVSYSVAQRTRELGIRSALGATRGDLARLVAGESAVVALVGISLGLGGAWAFSRALRALLYDVSPTDPVIYVAAPLLLFTMVVAATLVPARRAARTNPVDVIRAD